VDMDLHWYNTNYVGTHFGGSLYSMVDPFYMLIVMKKLGSGYIVWDKSAKIEFKRPGVDKVNCIFEVSSQQIEAIKSEVLKDGKSEPRFEAKILGENGKVVAQVEKILWIKEKP